MEDLAGSALEESWVLGGGTSVFCTCSGLCPPPSQTLYSAGLSLV